MYFFSFPPPERGRFFIARVLQKVCCRAKLLVREQGRVNLAATYMVNSAATFLGFSAATEFVGSAAARLINSAATCLVFPPRRI